MAREDGGPGLDEAGGSARRQGVKPAVLALALFAAFTIVLASPISLQPARRALAHSADTRLFLWTLSWDVHALLHRPLRLFDANIFYPEPRTLAYSEHLVGSAVLGAPFLLATGNPVLALNVVVLLSCVLSGWGAFSLARRLGIGTGGALVSGMIFAFAPPRFRLAQVHLATVQWIPFALGFLHSYSQEGRRRDLLVAMAFFTLQALTSGHGGLFLLLAAVALVAYLALLGVFVPLRKLVRDAGTVALALVVLNALFVVPYFMVRREAGLHRTIGAVYDWAPNASSFLAAPTHLQRALLALVPPLERQVAEAKAYLFPGWITLGLAALACRRRQTGEASPSTAGLGALDARHPDVQGPIGRARRVVIGFLEARGGVHLMFYAVLVALSLWASLGPRFGLYTALYRLFPGFDLIRVPSRLGVLTLLGLAVLAGSGFERLARRFSGARPALASLAVFLLAAEFAAFPLEAPEYEIERPAIDRWLAGQARPFTVLELPVAKPTDAVRSARFHSHYMLHSMQHWQPIVNGYSGIIPPRHEDLFHQLAAFPDEGGVRALELLGVKYVVLHRDFYEGDEYARVVSSAEAFPHRLILERDEEDGRVYSLPFARRGRWR